MAGGGGLLPDLSRTAGRAECDHLLTFGPPLKRCNMDARKTFLCIDDEQSVLLMEKLLLESAGFRVITASSGREAIEAFEYHNVDLVIMDYMMAGINGIETAKFLKRLKPDVPIVFLSAYAELPGETLGLAEWWAKKGEEPPDLFIGRLRSLVDGRDCTEKSSLAS